MNRVIPLITVFLLIISCSNKAQKSVDLKRSAIKLLIDTDANNELDDQHALAYAFLNNDAFKIVGITVNNTRNGNGIQGHYDEALRVIRLFNLENKMPLFKGATESYSDILPNINQPYFDGCEAIDFIIEQALNTKNDKLVLLPIGKLTNIALAIAKEPGIIDKIKVIWLGSNYPASGEYNLVNDTSAINPVIESGVEFQMVTVRYSDNTGTSAVRITKDEVKQNIKGKGPKVKIPVEGRHGGSFSNFGDYSHNLFEHASMHGDPPSRSLFDMAAVAVVKNPGWAEKVEIPAPKLIGEKWLIMPDNKNKIVIWENFDRDEIINDFFHSLNSFTQQ